MCVEITQTQKFNNNKMDVSNKKSYSVKKLLKQIFKQQKSQKVTAESMETLENDRNASLESESFENDINEKLSAMQAFDDDCDYPTAITSVPVHFIRTDQGTFFWTTNSAFEQLSCQQDRWAQA
ncbi:enhancer of split m4 protein-like [Musca vetustissima]|uniref:enhancer of split m4 protein-like n=1 Tax=Musca vetustissima TaxID=27455 RepID=UPI002AB74BD4|nr:enhancer of split m4 protein-like [Musca vetustissima]